MEINQILKYIYTSKIVYKVIPTNIKKCYQQFFFSYKDGEDGLISTSDEHSYSMATYLCRDINSAFYGGMNMQTSKLLQPAEKNVWNVSANCYRPERDSTFLDCVHLGLQFVKNVTYYSDSSSTAITQLPFMPDVCQAKTTLVSAMNPDNVVSDAWLIKVNCHSQPSKFCCVVFIIF